MTSAWILDPRNALLVVLAIGALAYIGLVVRAATRETRDGQAAARLSRQSCTSTTQIGDQSSQSASIVPGKYRVANVVLLH